MRTTRRDIGGGTAEDGPMAGDGPGHATQNDFWQTRTADCIRGGETVHDAENSSRPPTRVSPHDDESFSYEPGANLHLSSWRRLYIKVTSLMRNGHSTAL